MSQGSVGSGDTSAPGASRSFVDRLFGALRLDASVYEEVEHDPSALTQAAVVVALGSFAQGVSAAATGGQGAVLLGVIFAFLGWFLATGVVWLIGVRMMEHTSDYRELLRTLGFASAPQLLYALAIFPIGPLRMLVFVAVIVLVICAWVIAARQALDVSTGRAVVICVLATGVQVLIGMVLGLLVAAAGGAPAPPGAMAP